MKPRKYQFNNSTLSIIIGDITKSKAEVIVSPDNTEVSMNGGVSECICKAGGDVIRKDAQKKKPVQLGDVVLSTSGVMVHQKYIFHCITIDSDSKTEIDETQQSYLVEINKYILHKAIDKCFRLLEALELNSIAFPYIGGGGAPIPLKLIAETMADCIFENLHQTKNNYNVELYIINIDKEDTGYVDIIESIALRSNAALYKVKRLWQKAAIPELEPAIHELEPEQDQLVNNNYEQLEEEFIINLTIDGTAFEDVDIKVTDPNKTIRDQISSIVQVFELPKMDNGGNPIQYLLGLIINDGAKPEILDFEDEDGREQCLMDYNVQPGDRLYLISVPIAG